MNTRIIKGLIISVMLIFTNAVYAQLTLPEASPRATVSQKVGITNITIDYGRPSVKERKIWGALVPYGFVNLGFGTSTSAPWRVGANMNTTIEFTDDVKIEGKDIKAGTYGLHMAIEENGEVTVIFSHNTTSWGSYFYDESEDALRVKVQSKEIDHVENLTIAFDTFDATSTVASVKWEKKEIPFKIEVPVNELVMAGIKNDLRNSVGFNQSSWDQAAQFAFQAGDLDKALEWTEASIAGNFFSKPNFTNLSLKSQILTQQGKTSEADALLPQLISLGNTNQLFGLSGGMISSGKKAEALKVAKANVKQSNGAWPSNYGLARAYSANGDFKNAIKALNTSMKSVPERFKPRLQGDLEKLNKKEDIN